jgi:type IV secretion system protein VirB5
MSAESKARNPYLDARREWNERYGDYIHQARQWRGLAMVCAAIALAAVIGICWIGSQSKLVPYLVYVDHSGNAVVGHEAQTTEVDDNMVRALFAGFIEDWRSVSVDAGSERRSVDHVYAHLSRGARTDVDGRPCAKRLADRQEHPALDAGPDSPVYIQPACWL